MKKVLPIYIPYSISGENEFLYNAPILYLDEFLSYAKENSQLFMCYCELVVLPDGSIVIVKPSHTIMLHNLVLENLKDTDFEFSLTWYEEELKGYSRAISVRYDAYEVYDKETPAQAKTIKELVSKGLILDNRYVYPNRDDKLNPKYLEVLKQKGIIAS